MSKTPVKKRRLSAFQILGWIMIAGAGVTFVARINVEDDTLGLVIFLALLVPGFLMTLGLIGPPAGYFAHKKALQKQFLQRSQNRQNTAAVIPIAADVVPRIFTYPSPLAARIFLWGMAGFMLVLGGGGFIFVAIGDGFQAAFSLALFPLVGFPFFAWYAYRIPRIRFEIGPEGLNVTRLYGSVRITWPQIIMLKKLDSPAAASGFIASGSIYKIYSLDGNAEFYQSLTAAKELAAMIQSITKLEWE